MYTANGMQSPLAVRVFGVASLGGFGAANLKFTGGGEGLYHQLCLGSRYVAIANLRISDSLRMDNLGKSNFVKFAE